MPLSLLAAPDDDQRRLDRILRKALPDLPLSALHRLLRQGKITVDGKKARLYDRIKSGQLIEIQDLYGNSAQNNPAEDSKGKQNAAFEAKRNITDWIIYEGCGLLILNKPAGMVVHGEDSLEELVRSYLGPKLSPSLSFKPGPLHRLDKNSSGLIVFSASLEGARFFSLMLKEHRLHKKYLAITDGKIEKDEIWEDNLARDRTIKKTMPAGTESDQEQTDPPAQKFIGKAFTRIVPVYSGKANTLITAEIETGKTHQIRAQAAIHGHPLTGDRKYGGLPFPAKNTGAFCLHAWKIEFPLDGLPSGMPARFEAPLPQEFRQKIKELFPGIYTNPDLNSL